MNQGGEGAEDSAEKSHEPTERRLEEARKQGDIPLSADITTAAAYGGFALVALTGGAGALVSAGDFLRHLLDQADRLSETLFAGPATPLAGGWIARVVADSGLWLAVPAGAAVLALLAQRAPVLAPSKLAPKWSRLSPIATAQHKFGAQGLVEFAKGLFKLCIVSVVLGIYLWDNRDRIIGAARLEAGIVTAEMLALTAGLLVRVALIAALIGVFDLVWQRISHRNRQMMTRKELLDEMKEAEGDPHLKQQRRARAVAIATTPIAREVARADVVIVNPTHYAVALAWDRTSGGAPVCVAKGVDAMAARIREIAIENGVPIRSDPPTARALYAEVAVGDQIARRHYVAVAAAIRFAEGLRKRKAAR